MKPATAMTPEQQERLRALYRKCHLEHILLSPEAVADEFPHLVANLPPRPAADHAQPPAPNASTGPLTGGVS